MGSTANTVRPRAAVVTVLGVALACAPGSGGSGTDGGTAGSGPETSGSSETQDTGSTSTSQTETGDTETGDTDTGGPVEPCWEQTYKPVMGMSSAWVADVEVALDGRVLALGSETMPGEGNTPTQARLRAFSSDGDPLWEQVVPYPAAGGGVAIDADGNTYAGGDSGDGWPAAGWLRRYDADGELAWSVETTERILDVAVAADVLVVTGSVEVSEQVRDLWLSRRELESGAEVWSDTSASQDGGRAAGRAVAVSATGQITVVGEDASQGQGIVDGYAGAWTLDGAPVWSERVELAPETVADDVAIDADGTAVVVGWTTEAQNTKLWIRRYDEDGAELWTIGSKGSPLLEKAHGVAIGPDGDLFVVGQVADENSKTQVLVQRRSADGALVWAESFGTPTVWDDEHARAVDWLTAGAMVLGGQLTVGDEGGFAFVACWPAGIDD